MTAKRVRFCIHKSKVELVRMKMDEEIPPYSDIEKQNQWSILYDPALPEIFYFKYGVKASPIITFFGNHGWIHSFF